MLLDFYNKFTYRGTWNPETTYNPDDIVLYNGQLLAAVISSTDVNPQSNLEAWTTSYNYRGDWDSTSTYMADDAVIESNRLYYAPSNISANNNPRTTNLWRLVSNTLEEFVDDIRSLVWISLTKSDLPDSIILKPVYLRSAELDIAQLIGSGYDQQLQNATNREKIAIAVQMKTAAKIIPALPQIIEEQVLRERYEFATVDWQERVNLLEKNVTDSINPITPDPSVGGSLFKVADRYVGF